jgi:hypothetical protein
MTFVDFLTKVSGHPAGQICCQLGHRNAANQCRRPKKKRRNAEQGDRMFMRRNRPTPKKSPKM